MTSGELDLVLIGHVAALGTGGMISKRSDAVDILLVFGLVDFMMSLISACDLLSFGPAFELVGSLYKLEATSEPLMSNTFFSVEVAAIKSAKEPGKGISLSFLVLYWLFDMGRVGGDLGRVGVDEGAVSLDVLVLLGLHDLLSFWGDPLEGGVSLLFARLSAFLSFAFVLASGVMLPVLVLC